MAREALLARTLVELADTLVDDFDLVDLFASLTTGCVEVLDVAAAGLMIAGPDGELRVVSASSERMRLLELFELQAAEGPCLDCFRSGEAVVNQDLETVNGRWPLFAPRALEAGFRSAHALPMRLRGRVIGAINLFKVDLGDMRPADLAAGQALADVATIAVLQHQAIVDAQLLSTQLQQALTSRIVIEQAKGMVAERAGIDLDRAFDRLRAHARNHNARLLQVARDVIDKVLAVEALDEVPVRD